MIPLPLLPLLSLLLLPVASQPPPTIVPNTAVGGFTLTLLNGSSFTYDPRAPAVLPLVVYFHDEHDPYTVALFRWGCAGDFETAGDTVTR